MHRGRLVCLFRGLGQLPVGPCWGAEQVQGRSWHICTSSSILLSPSLLTAPGHPSHHCHPGTPLRADWWHGLVLIYFSLALLLSMSGKWRFRSCPNLQNVANALSFSKQRLNCHTTVQQCVHGHGVQHHGRFTFILAFHFLTSYK